MLTDLFHARLRRRRTALSGERGFESAEAAIFLPFLLLTILAIVQGGIWYHSTNLVQAAASNSYNAASLYGASSSDGISAGQATAAQVGSVLSDVRVEVTRTATEVVATVTATAPSLIPGVTSEVTKTVTGPTERWVP